MLTNKPVLRQLISVLDASRGSQRSDRSEHVRTVRAQCLSHSQLATTAKPFKAVRVNFISAPNYLMSETVCTGHWALCGAVARKNIAISSLPLCRIPQPLPLLLLDDIIYLFHFCVQTLVLTLTVPLYLFSVCFVATTSPLTTGRATYFARQYSDCRLLPLHYIPL